MTIREFAKSIGFEIVGNLKRLPDSYDSKKHEYFPIWIDEAGNKYCGDYKKKDAYCVITADGGVI